MEKIGYNLDGLVKGHLAMDQNLSHLVKDQDDTADDDRQTIFRGQDFPPDPMAERAVRQRGQTVGWSALSPTFGS